MGISKTFDHLSVNMHVDLIDYNVNYNKTSECSLFFDTYIGEGTPEYLIVRN